MKKGKIIAGGVLATCIILITFIVVISSSKVNKVVGADFENLFEKGFAGITTNEKELKDFEYVSSKHIVVKEGETIWYGPCDTTQNIQMATFDKDGNPVEGQKRSKPLEPSDTFSNNLVIYEYEVPKGVDKICFTTKTSLADVYTVSKTKLTCLNWVAYWDLQGVDTTQYVGENEFYQVKKGDKVYFGAITKEGAANIGIYDKKASKIEKGKKLDLKLVEAFGGIYGIYCYTVSNEEVKYIQIPTEGTYEQYLASTHVEKTEKLSEREAIDKILTSFGLQKPLTGTINALKGKSVLFVGDAIMEGAFDKESIYSYGGWPGRIGYFCQMDVHNGKDIDKLPKGNYEYVILQGFYENTDAIEVLFDKVAEKYPDAKVGYIVNFKGDTVRDNTSNVDRAVSVCKKKNIPYLDLYHDEGVVVDTEDGIHPTSAGYDASYIRIATWMASLSGEGKKEDEIMTKARVMSFNVFWSAADEVPNKGIAIQNRVKKVQDTILACDPDIFVLQEVSTGRNSWISILRDFIKEHDYGFYGFGHYKDRGIDTTENIDTSNISGSEAEMTPILWKNDKYECMEKGHYWASSTPEVAGTLWKGVVSSHSSGKLYPRCVNWVVLKDKETKEHIMVVSYHADPYTEKARKLSAQLVMERAQEIAAKYNNLAVLMAGDWNMERDQPTYSVITGNGYADSQLVAEKTSNKATFNAWKRSPLAFAEADYIFVNHNIYVSEFQVYSNMDPEQMGVYVSDHCPVIADIEF